MLATRKWLEALSSPNGVLKTVQRNGRQHLSKIGMPARTQDPWRLADLTRLEELLSLPVSSETLNSSSSEQDSLPVVPQDRFRLFLDSRSDLGSLSLPDGCRLLSNDELERFLGQTLDKCPSTTEWPIAINQASASCVLGLLISGKKVPPIEVILRANSNELMPTRLLIILEEKAELDLLQVFLGEANSAQSHLLEIHVGSDAKFTHSWLARGSGDSSLMSQISVQQDLNSEYALNFIQYGWEFARFESSLLQVDGNANSTIRGLQITKGIEQSSTHSTVRFDGPEGSFDQLQKSVISGSSHSIFHGLIDVPKIAQRTNASQLSRNLLLSDRARIDTKPELKIVADDVKCAHGATVSQLQQEELFYLQSRGIESKQATNLLLKGFCYDIFENSPVELENWINLDQLLVSLQ